MDFWSIAGNIVASIIVGVAVFAFGRSRGWWAKAKVKTKLRAGGGAQLTILVAQLEGDADQSQTRHVHAELRNQFPQGADALPRVFRYPEMLAIGPGDQGAALLERTRDKVPLNWAMTQNNLGNALWSLGKRQAAGG